MYIAYLDESGDKGWPDAAERPSRTEFFVLCCVLIHETAWLSQLDQLIALRRRLRARWNISTRAELRAEDFRWGRGAFRGLGIGLRDRMNIYKDCMEFQRAQMDTTVFAIAIQKRLITARYRDARDWAWQMAIEHIHKFCRDTTGDEHAMLLPDEGHGDFLRKQLRAMRRFNSVSGHFGGRVQAPSGLLVEDPRDMRSRDSYFTQLADWNAYAAKRSSYVRPTKKVPTDLWDRLGERRLMEVNSVTKNPEPGIVVFPRR